MEKPDISNYCRRMEARIANSTTPLWDWYGVFLIFFAVPAAIVGLFALLLWPK